MLTDDIYISDRLINVSIGTVKCIHMMNQSNPLNGIKYELFDDPLAGESLKNIRLNGQ